MQLIRKKRYLDPQKLSVCHFPWSVVIAGRMGERRGEERERAGEREMNSEWSNDPGQGSQSAGPT